MTEEQKKKIDAMTPYQMARLWRFASIGEPLLSGDTGDYFQKIFKERGGWTPELSKLIGWEND